LTNIATTTERLLERCGLIAVDAASRMRPTALQRVNHLRGVDAGQCVEGKVRRHDEALLQRLADELPALHRVVDDDMIRLAVQNHRLAASDWRGRTRRP